MSGYPPGVTVTNWGDYISEPYRREAAAFWGGLHNSDLSTQTTEWQFANGRWGKCCDLPLRSIMTILVTVWVASSHRHGVLT